MLVLKPIKRLGLAFFLSAAAISVFSCDLALTLQENSPDHKRFFSYDRFYKNTDLISRLSLDGAIHGDIKDFGPLYTAAIADIKSGRLEEAVQKLEDALKLWPEFFDTDLLLALVHDDIGDGITAARYYKGYLNKLREFYAGNYRISGALISVLSSGNIIDHDTAYRLIEEHLSEGGINIEKISPPVNIPPFFMYSIYAAVMVILYMFVFYKLAPYVKKLVRIKNPPEGFWICRACGAAAPLLAEVCIECRKPKTKRSKGGSR